MNHPPVSLKPVDRVEILTLIDNYIDLLLPPSEVVSRPPLAKEGKIQSDTLLAEHGLSLLITVYQGEEKHTILLDTGYTKIGVLHNIELLGVNLEDIEVIVISHGHMDHTGALPYLLDEAEVPIYGTALTLGLIRGRLEQYHLWNEAQIHTVESGDVAQIGPFEIRVLQAGPEQVRTAQNRPGEVRLFQAGVAQGHGLQIRPTEVYTMQRFVGEPPMHGQYDRQGDAK